MRKVYVLGGLLLISACFAMCRKPDAAALNNSDNFDPRLSGGEATVFNTGSSSFSSPIPGLADWDSHIHNLGDKFFSQVFVAAPAPYYQGLGPAYNNLACTNCHHNDGIGVPTFGTPSSSLLMRISVPGTDAHQGPNPAPGFGLQIQNLSIYNNSLKEADVNLSYTEQPYTYEDGTTASLRVPLYSLSNAYTALPAGYMLSPRMGPSIFGLGLLEAVPEATITSFADPLDANGDGIKGHANYVYNPYTQKNELGRFGRKANTSSLEMQVATAFQQDMGITSYMQPQKSVWGQSQMKYVVDTVGTDIPDSILNAVTFYIRSLAVPARRNVTDAQVLQGEKLFTQVQCASCHIPTMYTGVNVLLPALSNQRIHPYTDLLVHDMGTGLADNRADYMATGTEWRTPALWGIGLLTKTNGTPYYLHDGRARTLEEAILWHDGEAKNSKTQFTKLSKTDRDAVLAFLQSL